MEIGGVNKGRRVRPSQRIYCSAYTVEHCHSLQFYNLPPTENITLKEFEDLASERLRVLRAVESIGIRYARGSNDYKSSLEAELRKLWNDGILRGLTRTKINENNYENEELLKKDTIEKNDVKNERRKDHISHFILRLAYCKTEDLRRWFIAQEIELFRFRFQLMNKDGIKAFLRLHDLHYTPISSDDKARMIDELKNSRFGMTEEGVEKSEYYRIHFTEVLELVRGTKVYLEKGFAFVPESELVVVVVSAFRSRLSRDLVVMSRSLPQLSEEGRLLPMLSNLSQQYLGQDFGSRKSAAGNVTANMLEQLSKDSYPLCMQNLHQSLRQYHHLKHWGRQQYGLFLKGIGLSLEEALKFWRMEFTRIMDGDKFDRHYAYNIRHNYGKEGKRADYTPYSCVKIITSNPPAAKDFHGCPFRHFEVDLLRQRLQSFRLPNNGINEIVDLVKQGHYQLACGRHFELRNNLDVKFIPQHPNQYFEDSQRVIQGLKPTGGVASAPTESSGITLVPVGKKTVQSASHCDDADLVDPSCWEEMDIDEFK